MQAKQSPIVDAINANGAQIVSTVAAQVGVTDQWVKLGKDLAKAGVTPDALRKGTEKNPNKAFYQVAYDALRSFVVAGVSAKRKPESFPYHPPGASGDAQVSGKAHKWTVGEIVATNAAWLRENDVSETFRAVRQRLMAMIDQLIGRVIFYIDRELNPDKARGVKNKDKGDDKPAAPAMPETWSQVFPMLAHMLAKANTMHVSDERAETLTAGDISRIVDGLAQARAVLTRYIK